MAETPADRRIRLIVNPISGTNRSLKDKALSAANKLVPAAGFELEVSPTEYPGHATELAAEAASKGYYAVFACGGDGTVNETASALCGTATALGIIPAGSGNGLARHIEIPINPRKAVACALKCHVEACDYATVNGKPFFCTFGIGFDAAVSARFAAKKKRGLAMYLKSALDEFVAYKPETYILEINGQTVTKEAMIVACCNASQYGNNAYIAPAATIRDGLLDIVVVHPRTFLSKTLFGVEMMTGLISGDAKVDIFKADNLTIRRNAPGYAHIDGEPLTLPDVLDVKLHHARLNILTNPGKKKFTPFISAFRKLFS